MLILPFTSSVGHYEFDTFIEDATYTFDVRWNERDGAYYFDLLDGEGLVIARGLKITVGSYIGRSLNHPLFKRGVLAAIDTTGEYLDPTFDDLGTRVEVRYYTIEDLVAEVYGT